MYYCNINVLNALWADVKPCTELSIKFSPKPDSTFYSYIVRKINCSEDLLNAVFRLFSRQLSLYVLVIYIVTSQGCGTLVHHKVEIGDTLYSIGFYYGQDYRDIAQWNDIPSPYVLHSGQWLRVAPPEKEWWEGRKQHNNNKPYKSDSYKYNNKNHIARSSGGSTAIKSTDANASTVVEKTNHLVKSKSVQTEDFTERATPIRRWIWPSKGTLKDPHKKFSERNKGIDIKGKQGQPIRASAAGKVVYSGNGLIGYGRLIIIKHNKTYLSAYAHNESVSIKEGDMVKQGQQIARMGQTPEQHILLHFEIRKNGKPVDPLRLLSR